MGFPGLGHRGYIQFGREATYGTAVAATHRIPFVSCETRPVGGTIDSEMMNNARWLHGIYQGPKHYETTLVVELWYEGMLLLLDGLMGTGTYGANGGTTSGGSPFAHTITQQDLLNSYTFQIIEGRIPATTCQRLLGAKIDRAEISGSKGSGNDAILRLTLTLLSRSYQTAQAITGSLNAVTALPILFHEMQGVSAFLDGTADVAADKVLQNFTVSINNNLARRHHSTAATILEPIAEGFCEVEIRLTKEFQTVALLDAFNAFTAAVPTEPTLVFGVTSSKRFTISTPGTAVIPTYGHPISGPGIIMQDVTWKGFRANPGGAGPLQLLVENTQATIVT